MKTQPLLLLVTALFLSSCRMPSPIEATPTLPIRPTEKPLSTVTPVCISSEPVQGDIDRALDYTGEIFDSPDWERSYHVAENRVAVTWGNYTQGSVVYLEALIFSCGYEDPDLDDYFSDENWKTIFENYESYELIAECETNDGFRLYEFDTSNLGFEYQINYWVENDTATRVIVLMMTIPVGSESLLDQYASRLFPRLASCQ